MQFSVRKIMVSFSAFSDNVSNSLILNLLIESNTITASAITDIAVRNACGNSISGCPFHVVFPIVIPVSISSSMFGILNFFDSTVHTSPIRSTIPTYVMYISPFAIFPLFFFYLL